MSVFVAFSFGLLIQGAEAAYSIKTPQPVTPLGSASKPAEVDFALIFTWSAEQTIQVFPDQPNWPLQYYYAIYSPSALKPKISGISASSSVFIPANDYRLEASQKYYWRVMACLTKIPYPNSNSPTTKDVTLEMIEQDSSKYCGGMNDPNLTYFMPILKKPEKLSPCGLKNNPALTYYLPTLSWQNVGGAEKYKFTIYNAGRLNNEIYWDLVSGPPVINFAKDKLFFGRTYEWGVSAIRGTVSVDSAHCFFAPNLFPSPKITDPVQDNANILLPYTIKWTETAGADYYRYEIPNTQVGGQTSALFYEVKPSQKFQAGKAYTFRVQACSSAVQCGDWAERKFSVTLPSESITILSPKQGEIFYADITYLIQWQSAGIDDFCLSLWNNDKRVDQIKCGIGSMGETTTYSWWIKSDQADGDKYQIQVCEDVLLGCGTEAKTGYFTIGKGAAFDNFPPSLPVEEKPSPEATLNIFPSSSPAAGQVQFKAFYDSDGAGIKPSQDVTDKVKWSVWWPTDALSIDDKGLATCKKEGPVEVRAEYLNISSISSHTCSKLSTEEPPSIGVPYPIYPEDGDVVSAVKFQISWRKVAPYYFFTLIDVDGDRYIYGSFEKLTTNSKEVSLQPGTNYRALVYACLDEDETSYALYCSSSSWDFLTGGQKSAAGSGQASNQPSGQASSKLTNGGTPSWGFTCPSQMDNCPAGSVCIPNPLCADTFEQLLDAITNFIFWIGITLAPVIFIIAGFLYVTALGDPHRIETAKKMMLYAVIGLAVLLLARGLVAVLKSIIGVTS